MTAILPFVPAIPATAAQFSAAPGDEPAISFADILESSGMAKPAPLPPRMFAFSELGMFGRHGAQILPGEPQSGDETSTEQQIPAPLPEQAEPPSLVQTANAYLNTKSSAVKSQTRYSNVLLHREYYEPAREQSAGSNLVSERNITGPSVRYSNPVLPLGQPDIPRLRTQFTAARPNISPSTAIPVAQNVAQPIEALPASEPEESAGMLPGEQDTPQIEPRVSEPSLAVMSSPGSEQSAALPCADRTSYLEGSGKSVPLPAPQNRAANSVNLLVSGSGDALMIVARASSESAEENGKLRRAVEDTAAEFGMDVAEFRLNGVAAERSFVSMTGGNHGSRTR